MSHPHPTPHDTPAPSLDGLTYGDWSDAEKLALSCRILAREGHSETLAGQVTVRQPDGSFLTTPLAHSFGEIRAQSVIRIDDSLRVLEGRGVPNPAVRFHLWVYRRRPDVNCVIHTHPPYVSALSMTGEPLQVAHMDATPFFDDCAFLPSGPACRSPTSRARSFPPRWARSAACCWPTTAFWRPRRRWRSRSTCLCSSSARHATS